MFVVKHVFIISCGLITQSLLCHVMLLLHSHPSPLPLLACVQVALASDHVGSAHEQLVALQLTVTEEGGVRKHHQVELNRAELETLVTSLEGCSKVGRGRGRVPLLG